VEAKKCKLVTIIVFYNAYQDCIELLSDLSESISENHKVVIVDNKSNEAEINKLKKSVDNPNIYLSFNTGNNGYGSGINFGFNYAKAFNPEIIQVLNADTRVWEQNYISEILKQFEIVDDAGIIAPAVRYTDGSIQNTIMPFVTLFGSIFFKKTTQSKSFVSREPLLTEAEVLNGVCLFIRSSVFKKISGFDEDFFMYGEEHDLCHRVYKSKFRCYFYPIMSLVHKEAYKTKNETIDWRFLLVRANQVQFLYKNRKYVQGAILSIMFSTRLVLARLFKQRDFDIKVAILAVLKPKWYNGYLKRKKNTST
jgi:GT2 family glycosyltransferase